MKLTENGLCDSAAWTDAGFVLPRFDRKKVADATRQRPKWVHFGAGNIFRAYPATLQQTLLDAGDDDTGIIVAEGYDEEIIDAVFTPHDNLSLTVTLNADGTIEKTVVASMTEALKANPAHPDFARLREIFANPSLQMVSFTITEKGYSLLGPDDGTAPAVLADFANGPDAPTSYMGKVAALLHHRYRSGGHPVALVSMDNYSHNGDNLAASIRAYADAWEANGTADAGFREYVGPSGRVAFPCTMIDKITPRPDAGVKQLLIDGGFEDAEPVVTAKGTYVAPFVNAEKAAYLVIDDRFPNGRPPLDKAGVIFTDGETVDKVEKMKVSTCLNCLHLALAIFGSLLGFTRISTEMEDSDLRRMVEILGYEEGLSVVVDPGIVNPRAFLDEVLTVRFPNPFVPDTPQRIALDCSQKFPSRFGQTILAYMRGPGTGSLKIIPLAIAAWCRYLMGVDDKGEPFTPSPDPMLAELSRHVASIRLGDTGPFGKHLRPILSNAAIFGVDLYEAGLGNRIESNFAEMVTGREAVRSTLHRHVAALKKRAEEL
ncbi:MAG: mannitol dehydrogenase family protein [Planctomycetaceae bacterium]|nr:mannitol dehydrogenase family protein [Planctomycetaceae bacterium]